MKSLDLSEIKRGIVCFTFDDRNFDGWLEALPIFRRYNAHASFFVSGAIDETALTVMKRLAADGHTVGLHTLNHADAPEYFDKYGAEAYVERELMPQLEPCRHAGLDIRSLAYPNNRRDERTDGYLSSIFRHFRAGVADSPDHERFVPIASLASRRLMRGFGLGEYYSTTEDELLSKIRRAANENAAVTFFSHNIAPGAKHIHLPTELLISALETAQAEGVTLVGFDELA